MHASFEETDFWDKLNVDPKLSTRVLVANALCTRMDLASAIYHSPTSRIEIYGMGHLQAYSHYDREHQLDWRFVGYAIMASGNNDEAANKIVQKAFKNVEDSRIL